MAYVYRFRHFITNEVIYVGKTKRDIKKRMDEHFSVKGHLSKKCYNKVGNIEYLKVNSDADARLVEQYMINRYKPRYNVDGKTDDNQAFKFNLFMGLNYFGRWKLYERRRYSFLNLKFIRFRFLKTKNETISKGFDIGVNLLIIYIIVTAIMQSI